MKRAKRSKLCLWFFCKRFFRVTNAPFWVPKWHAVRTMDPLKGLFKKTCKCKGPRDTCKLYVFFWKKLIRGNWAVLGQQVHEKNGFSEKILVYLKWGMVALKMKHLISKPFYCFFWKQILDRQMTKCPVSGMKLFSVIICHFEEWGWRSCHNTRWVSPCYLFSVVV